MKCHTCQHMNPPDTVYCGQCGTKLSSGPEEPYRAVTLRTSIPHLATGSLFAGRYRIIEELGRGGMGKVYKAFDERVREKVALKLIHPDIAQDDRTIERFQNEIRFTRKIVHKNVGRMYDLGEEDGTYYITMEYVSGQDLKGLIRQTETLPVSKSLVIARQVCEGLAEAHRTGTVHRDLKPSNIMIDQDGNARIMDFGIAHSLQAKGVTAEGLLIGTPDYMSPEQVEGKEVDQRSDIYSLGVMLFEMLTGRLPFTGDTQLNIALKHRTEAPPVPKEVNARIPDEVSDLILKCLEKKKEKRFDTSEELLARLTALEKDYKTHDTPILLKKPSSIQTLAAQLGRKKVILPAAVVTGLVLVVLLIWVLIPQAQAAPRAVAVISFENQTGDPAYDYLQKAIPNLLISSLEQSEDLRVASWERMRDLLKQMGKDETDFIDSETGFEICRREGITTLIAGNFTKMGDMFATNVTVYDVHDKTPLKRASSRGEDVSSILRRQIDDLSREVARGVGLAERRFEKSTSQIADTMTSSMEAYDDFLRGRESIERYYWNDARVFLERAVEKDPDFALAHFYLSRAYASQADVPKAKAAMESFKKLGRQVKGREGEYIEAMLALYDERDEAKYVKLMEQLRQEFPKEKRYSFDLGAFYYGKAKWDEALVEFQRALELDPVFGAALNMTAYIYSYKGQYEKSLEYFQKYAAAYPRDANPLDSMGDLYHTMGRLDEAVAKYKAALEVKPDFGTEWKVAYIYALKEDYREAVNWVERYNVKAASAPLRLLAHELKALFFIQQGQVTDAIRTLEEAESLWRTAEVDPTRRDLILRTHLWISYDWGAEDRFQEYVKERMEFRIKNKVRSEDLNKGFLSYYAGLMDVKKDRITQAKSRLAEVKAIGARLNEEEKKLYEIAANHLERDILLAEGSVDKAMALFKEAPLVTAAPQNINSITQRNLPYVEDFAARCLLRKGEVDKAIAEYERLVDPDPAKRKFVLVHPFARIRLARLYETKGLKDKAAALYAKTLEVCKDADAELPLFKEARSRLAALQAAGGR